MALDFDSYFGVPAKALLIRDQRASQLANNLANADTPNYKAKDVNFNDALQQAMGSSAQNMVTTNPEHIRTPQSMSVPLKFRVPQQVSLDGNTVDKDIETTAYLNNTLAYQADITFLTSKIRMMRSALRGE